jgi:hypothetical protein
VDVGQAGDRQGGQYWSALVAEVDEVDDMIWQAVRAGFGYFQREAGYTRTGSDNTRVHGRETSQWHEADLPVAHWLQHASPQAMGVEPGRSFRPGTSHKSLEMRKVVGRI